MFNNQHHRRPAFPQRQHVLQQRRCALPLQWLWFPFLHVQHPCLRFDLLDEFHHGQALIAELLCPFLLRLQHFLSSWISESSLTLSFVLFLLPLEPHPIGQI